MVFFTLGLRLECAFVVLVNLVLIGMTFGVDFSSSYVFSTLSLESFLDTMAFVVFSYEALLFDADVVGFVRSTPLNILVSFFL